jgi:hypothetical protein
VTGPEVPQSFRAFRLLQMCDPETTENIETAFHVFEQHACQRAAQIHFPFVALCFEIRPNFTGLRFLFGVQSTKVGRDVLVIG